MHASKGQASALGGSYKVWVFGANPKSIPQGSLAEEQRQAWKLSN